MSSYLRQIAHQATGRNLPGQVRPLFRPMGAFSARRDPEQPFDETILEPEGPSDGTVARPHALAVRPGLPGAASTPTVPPARAVPPRQPEAERAERPRTGSERSFAPTSSQRLDSIEALLPSRGVDESGHKTPASASRPSSQETRSREGGEAEANEPPPLRDGSATASAHIGVRQRDLARRQPEVGLPERSARASAPEIHIHIGRVELTGLHAAPAKSTPRSIGKKPMSLDDYLRQRDGRRS